MLLRTRELLACEFVESRRYLIDVAHNQNVSFSTFSMPLVLGTVQRSLENISFLGNSIPPTSPLDDDERSTPERRFARSRSGRASSLRMSVLGRSGRQHGGGGGSPRQRHTHSHMPHSRSRSVSSPRLSAFGRSSILRAFEAATNNDGDRV